MEIWILGAGGVTYLGEETGKNEGTFGVKIPPYSQLI